MCGDMMSVVYELSYPQASEISMFLVTTQLMLRMRHSRMANSTLDSRIERALRVQVRATVSSVMPWALSVRSEMFRNRRLKALTCALSSAMSQGLGR